MTQQFHLSVNRNLSPDDTPTYPLSKIVRVPKRHSAAQSLLISLSYYGIMTMAFSNICLWEGWDMLPLRLWLSLSSSHKLLFNLIWRLQTELASENPPGALLWWRIFIPPACKNWSYLGKWKDNNTWMGRGDWINQPVLSVLSLCRWLEKEEDIMPTKAKKQHSSINLFHLWAFKTLTCQIY